MPFRDIFKRQVEDLFNTKSTQVNPSLGEDVRNEFDKVLGDAIDPGREEREAARQAAELEEIRAQKGTGQVVQIDGLAGDWEAVEMFHFDEQSVSFTLVDRQSGEGAQLSAVDDGTVLLDSPIDQHGATLPGAFWRTETATGIRLERAELTAGHSRGLLVTCDLRGDIPPDEPEYQEPDYSA